MCYCSWRISLDLLDLHQEAFELWCVSVGIDHRWREQIGGRAVVLGTRVGKPFETPVNGYADLEGLFPGDGHLPDAFGDHSLAKVAAAGARNLDLIAASDLQLCSQLLRYLHEGLRNKLHVHGIVFGP